MGEVVCASYPQVTARHGTGVMTTVEVLWLKRKQENSTVCKWILVLPQALLRRKQYTLQVRRQLLVALRRCDYVVISDNKQKVLQHLQDIVRAHELQRIDRTAVAHCLLSGGRVRF